MTRMLSRTDRLEKDVSVFQDASVTSGKWMATPNDGAAGHPGLPCSRAAFRAEAVQSGPGKELGAALVTGSGDLRGTLQSPLFPGVGRNGSSTVSAATSGAVSGHGSMLHVNTVAPPARA